METDTIICIGDCRTNVAKLRNASVQCVVTSPPYFLQRLYGDQAQEMGQTPLVSEYIAELVSLFEVVKSKLKDKGSVWVNIGDTYAVPMKAGCRNGQGVGQGDQIHYPERKGVLGIQPSSLVGIPARFQIAMTDAGWCCRQSIVWNKKAPKPESVKNRCTRSHEMIYHFTKSKKYFYDHAASQEKGTTQNKRNRRDVWNFAPERNSDHPAPYPKELVMPCILTTSQPGDLVVDPFHGSGTTARVAQEFGRNYVGFELYPKYSDQWRDLHGVEVTRDFLVTIPW